MVPVVVLPPPLHLEEPLLEVMPLLKRSLLRRRKKVYSAFYTHIFHMLTTYIAKEESDEDMGFGLFD